MLCSIPVTGQLATNVRSGSPTGVIESRPLPLLQYDCQKQDSSKSLASDGCIGPLPKVA